MAATRRERTIAAACSSGGRGSGTRPRAARLPHLQSACRSPSTLRASGTSPSYSGPSFAARSCGKRAGPARGRARVRARQARPLLARTPWPTRGAHAGAAGGAWACGGPCGPRAHGPWPESVDHEDLHGGNAIGRANEGVVTHDREEAVVSCLRHPHDRLLRHGAERAAGVAPGKSRAAVAVGHSILFMYRPPPAPARQQVSRPRAAPLRRAQAPYDRTPLVRSLEELRYRVSFEPQSSKSTRVRTAQRGAGAGAACREVAAVTPAVGAEERPSSIIIA